MRNILQSIRRPALLLILVLAAGVPYEPLVVSGTVTSADTGRPLAGVQVFVPTLGIGTLTNHEGRYSLEIPDRNAITELQIRAEVIGHESGAKTLRPAEHTSDEPVTLGFQLRRTALALQEVVVSAGRAADATRVHATAPAAWERRERDREQYAFIDENRYHSSADQPLSTFSIDVDRASYSNVRRFLVRERRLPPIDAVRVEELINYFPYDYSLPRDGRPLAVTHELGRAPWNPGHALLRIGLASTPIDTADLPPSNLVFLLDVSGSMQSPDKLPLVKRSMRLLVDQLREEDRVAIVVYAGAAGLVLEPTSGLYKDRILDAIDRLEAGGSTAGGAGLRLAYQVARRNFAPGGNNRVILATDGDFNVGENSDSAMTRLIEDKRREGTFLTVLGFGTGNLQSEKMQTIAQHGNGNYAYIDGLDEARKVLVGEMGGTLLTVAKDVKVQVEFNPLLVESYRLIGYENRLLAAEDFNDDGKDAGDLGAGHTVTALYEIVPVGSSFAVDVPGVDPLRYQTVTPRPAAGAGDEIAFIKVRYKEPDGNRSRLIERPVLDRLEPPSTDFRFASAVAGFGMLLRQSEHRGSMATERVLALARAGLGDDPDGYRRGFLEMVHAYRSLTAATDRDVLRR